MERAPRTQKENREWNSKTHFLKKKKCYWGMQTGVQWFMGGMLNIACHWGNAN